MTSTTVRLLAAGVIAAAFVAAIGSPSIVTAAGTALPACTAAQLVPQLGATTVNQGVGSYADTGSNLVRGKDTLVRFFLVNQSAVNTTCAGTTYVRSANLTVTNASGGASYGPTGALQTFGSSGAAIPSSTVSVDSNADPKFVLPAANATSCLNTPCTDSAPFTLTFAASITYSTSLSATAVALSLSSVTATFDKSTNALRILAVPMGDKSQSYSTQFSASAELATRNGFAALSRIYPLPAGVSSTLNTTTGGVRYKLDLSAMLDVKSVSGAYDGNNKFCGTQANFDAGIKSLLTGFLSVYNSSITDTNQRADRVLGVVDKNISDGSTSSFNCAEAMASTNSPVAWVRAIPDQAASGKTPAVPSMTGALMAMEIAHTFGLDTTLTFHSPNTQADLTAPDKAYNLSSRSYLADDRSAMRFVSTNPFNNNNALFEKDDFGHMLCNLGGSLTANCTAASTGTVVAAGPTFAIFGTTDFTAGGTHVLESFESEDDPIFAAPPGGDLVLRFFNSSGQVGDVSPGGSLTIDKTLTTPVIPPKPDVVFLADTTGSMGAALDNVKSNIVSIMSQVRAAQPDAQFGAASYKDFACTLGGVTETPFSLDHAVTADTSAVQTAINTWSAPPGSGCDIPEAQLWALHKLATDSAVGWRTGSSRIVVWIGDAPGHDPSNGISQSTAISELNAAGIRVIAINLVNNVEHTSLDDTGQATAIVNATGGVLKTTSDAAQVSPSILAGLTNLPATVTHTVTTCDPALSVSFDAESKTVTSGEPVSWTETVNIASSAAPGSTLTCTVQFLVNGVLPDDPAFTQRLSIKLTGGDALIATFEGANPAALRAHVIYDCGNGEKEPAFVALEGTEVASSIVQFQQNVDPSLSCANASGTASLTIVGTNGVDTVEQTVPTSPSTFPVSDKKPTASIYQPTVDALIPYTSQMSLNGHVADPEDGNRPAHWAISGPASASGDGDVVDVPPPPGGWPAGDYTIQLSGSDADGNTATATVTVHVAHYTFAGFFQPVDNPPVVNTGRAGNTYPLKFSLTQNGTVVSDLSAVVALRYAAIGCGAQPPDALETSSSGGTVLRYDTTTQQYVYNWQTPKQAGCYVVTVTLADGSTWPAFFQLK